MWSLRLIFRKNKGFTLIEFLLSLGLTSIIILSLLSILDFSKKASIIGNETDELMLNGRYALEYIKKEVKSADMILPSGKINGLNGVYQENVGFVIVTKEGQGKRFTTYYRKKDGGLYRISGLVTKDEYPSYTALQGHNEVCEYIESIDDTRLDQENKIIYLELKLQSNSGQELDFKTNIFIRCPIDY